MYFYMWFFFFKEVVMDYAVQEQLKYLIHNHNIYLAFKV